MVALFFATVLAASFALIMTVAERAKTNLNAVAAISYTTGACVNLVVHAASGGSWVPETGTWLVGLCGGLSFITGFSFLSRAIAARGVSVASTVFRLSVVLPMLASWLLWGERISTLPTMGAVLALASLPLLTVRSKDDLASFRASGGLVLIGLFFANGACALSLAVFERTRIHGQNALFLAFVFATAAVVAIIRWMRQRQGTSPQDLLHGLPLGLADSLGNMALVASIAQLPGLIVFPVYSSTGVVLTALFARLVWREEITRQEWGGIGLAIVAVVLANL